MKINKLITLMGVYQCLILIFPLGFYKIEPPPNSVGTLWGFLVTPAYIIFFAGILLVFRSKIPSYVKIHENTIIILSGLMSSIIAFLTGVILYPLTQKLIEEIYQISTNTEVITYLDVETGGIFFYLSYVLGVLCLGYGTNLYFDRMKTVNREENLVSKEK